MTLGPACARHGEFGRIAVCAAKPQSLATLVAPWLGKGQAALTAGRIPHNDLEGAGGEVSH
jgi:hypothetical protein